MSNFTRNSLYVGAIIVVFFVGIIFYAGKKMPEMTGQSKRVITEFFTLIQAKKYAEARELLGSNTKEEVSAEKLASKWQKFETDNGTFQRWEPADVDSSNGGRICLWPPYVDYFVRVSGAKSDDILYFRVSPEGENWKIERYSEFRKNPLPPTPKPSQ